MFVYVYNACVCVSIRAMCWHLLLVLSHCHLSRTLRSSWNGAIHCHGCGIELVPWNGGPASDRTILLCPPPLISASTAAAVVISGVPSSGSFFTFFAAALLTAVARPCEADTAAPAFLSRRGFLAGLEAAPLGVSAAFLFFLRSFREGDREDDSFSALGMPRTAPVLSCLVY